MIDWSLVSPLVWVAIFVALAFDFYNGLHDAANSIATVVATRALPVWGALIMAGIFNFVGAFAGTAVAATIGSGIIVKDSITTQVVLAGLVGGIFWNVVTVFMGIPISSSHSLVGGLIGAAVAKAGLSGVQWPAGSDFGPLAFILGKGAIEGAVVAAIVVLMTRSRWRAGLILGAAVGSAVNLSWAILYQHYAMQKLLATLLFIGYSPFIGFILAFLLTTMIAWSFQHVRPGRVKHLFRWLQVASSSAYSFGHGTNDAQKTMGVITALLLAVGAVPAVKDIKHFPVPVEVIVACGIAMGLGTMIGGWKIVRTMGTRLTHLDTPQGFAAESASAVSLFFLANQGVPVSTTHSIAGSIMGVGAYQRVSAVSWGVARRIVMAWLITIPLAAAVGALVYLGIARFL
jgi:PiT family inorganic phosphate transporter